MKKLSIILAVLLCIGLSIPAYAQGVIYEGVPEEQPYSQNNSGTNTGDNDAPIDEILVSDVLSGEVSEIDIYSQSNPNAYTDDIFNDPDWYKEYGYETDPRVDNPDWTLEDVKKYLDDTGENDVILEGGNSNRKNGFNYWLLTIGSIFLLGMAAIVYFNRSRLVPAMQTNSGNIVTGNATVSRKQTITAIKNSAVAPSDDVFTSILKKVEKAHSERD